MTIKVCGMREPDNIRALSVLEVDWMGVILYPPSSRSISPTQVRSLPGGLPKMGVAVNESLATLIQWVEELELKGVQLHGQESPAMCKELKEKFPSLTLVKAIPVRTENDLKQVITYEGYVDFFLFDTKGPKAGGNGVAFDWNLLNAYKGTTPFWLSGGIGPESLLKLTQFSHPCWEGIDLNSRFETAPGQKNIQALTAFIEKFRHHDNQN